MINDNPAGNSPPKQWLFEVCVTSLEAAQASQRGGASRIELCSDLAVGGVTPPDSLLASVVRAISIPVHVLIRPRAGDFVYTQEEFALMRRQIETARAAGASGIAVGVLLDNARVDVARCIELVELARPMKATFHRAFDETPDLAEALEDVVRTGADCVLTSGGAPDVFAGAECLARLCRQAGSRIQVMAGGGIRLRNLSELVRQTGIVRLHGSLSGQSETGQANKAPREEDVRQAVRLLQSAFAELPEDREWN